MGLFGPPNIEKLRRKSDVEAVIKILEKSKYNKDDNFRREAIEALGFIGDARAVELLIQALNDKSEDIRESAASSLGKIKDIRAVIPLIQMLKDKDRSVRKSAASSLGEIGDESMVEPLIQKLKDKDRFVRQHAAAILKKIGDAKTIGLLIQALNDEDNIVRAYAAEILGEIGDTKAVEALKQALKDKDKLVREDAARALKKIKDKGMVKELRLKIAKEADQLVDELIKIGLDEGFITSSDARFCGACGYETIKEGQKRKCPRCGRAQNRRHFNGKHMHKHARGIGKRLYELGGMKLMQTACARVRGELGPSLGRELEVAWAYIGTWLP